MATMDENTLHHSTVTNTVINCYSILLPTTTQGSIYKQCTKYGWRSANCTNTTYIKLLRYNQKRKHEIEAECKQMDKQRKNCKIRLIPAVDRLRSYSVNYWTEMSTVVVIQSVGVDSISMIVPTVRCYQISARNNCFLIYCFLIINSSMNHGKDITKWIRGAFIPRSTKRLTYQIMWDRIYQNRIIFGWTRRCPWSTKRYCKIRANVTAKI